ncbi:S41 family peptidase [Eudoraea chungangensis]|uniref:S41 family peptidase n=1 Tax=Eudoraea chungangensis TaxID=1481905 RepID=UPI0023EDE0D2|nr:S41 family peptidase [Eudoraea chungangensis]
MHRTKTIYLLFFLSSLIAIPGIKGQENLEPLNQAEISTVIDSISNKLTENYVFPKIALAMSNSIQKKFKDGAYKDLNDPEIFANILTEDLRDISKDKHLRVTFTPRRITEMQQVTTTEDSLAYLKRRIARMERNNFGFKEVKILSGNIGYLDLRGFSDVEYGGETAVAAMNFLSNADAIIIDLRNNGGGSPAMIQLISSYFFESDPVHLNNFYWRPTDSNSQTWTLPHVSGTRSPDTPLYILTSSGTFSAAEEFSYNLKNLERATLIGETTGGGAHPGGSLIATERFMVWVPTGRAINPITNTNWEGTGVTPHIKTSARKALDKAYTIALEKLISQNPNEESLSYYEWPLTAIKLKTNPITLSKKSLEAFVGSYGPRRISMTDGKLYYQRDGGSKYALYPYSENAFMLDGMDSFRIRFLFEDEKIIALEGLYSSGRRDKNLRD